MNEQKKAREDYFSQKISKQQEIAIQIVLEISLFIDTYKPKAIDLFILNDLIKQLNSQNGKIPRKVLRSIRNRFIKIQNEYQK